MSSLLMMLQIDLVEADQLQLSMVITCTAHAQPKALLLTANSCTGKDQCSGHDTFSIGSPVPVQPLDRCA